MHKTTAPIPDLPGRWVIPKFGPPSVLQWQVFDPLPEPTNDELLISIITAGISGADNIQRAGGYPDPRLKEPGFTPGYDFVGEVLAKGPNVPASRKFAKGDRVTSMCIFGAYGTHIVLPAGDVIKIKDTDDPVDVCALPLNYMTAYGMLKRAGADLPPGSSILIGSVSGGVGTALAQLVRAFDMGLTMYGTCSPGKFDFVKSLGVVPIDRNAKDVPAQIRALTDGQGVDVAYDAIGSEESLRASHASTKAEIGKVIVIGVMSMIAADGSGMVDREFDAFGFIYQGPLPRMRFWAVTTDYYFQDKDLWIRDFELVLQTVRDGKLKPFIGKLFRLSEAVVANEMLVSGVGVHGKLEFIVDEELAKNRNL